MKNEKFGTPGFARPEKRGLAAGAGVAGRFVEQQQCVELPLRLSQQQQAVEAQQLEIVEAAAQFCA